MEVAAEVSTATSSEHAASATASSTTAAIIVTVLTALLAGFGGSRIVIVAASSPSAAHVTWTVTAEIATATTAASGLASLVLVTSLVLAVFSLTGRTSR